MTYYIKGGSRFEEANPKVWVLLNILGYDDDKYLDQDWKDIDYNFGGAGAIVDTLDPFWRLGGATGGEKEVMIGLWDDWRLRITEAGGLMQWNPDESEWQALGGGAAGDIFKTINCPAGTDPVADAVDDTLNITATGDIIITGNAGTDTVDFSVTKYTDNEAKAAAIEAGAYDEATWNGNTMGATKDAIRDKIESMGDGGLNNVVEDLTPQLGGNLDCLDKAISNIKSIAFNDGDKTITEVKDEDNMASNSDTKICTQQSIKAYTDNNVIDNTVFEGTRYEGTALENVTTNINFVATDNYTYHCLGINLYRTSAVGTTVLEFYIYINGGYRKVYSYSLGVPQHDYVQLYIPVLTRRCRIAIVQGGGVTTYYTAFATYQPCVDDIYYNGHDY